MKEEHMMWVIILITPLALWMTLPNYVEAIRGGYPVAPAVEVK